jgi:DNA-binding transcriptional ArsR family regulator
MVVDQATDARHDRLLRALADGTRRDIVRTLAPGGLSVTRLAERYPMSFAAVQKHVAVLERAGLVEKRRRGRERLVTARIEELREARALLEDLEGVWRTRLERFGRVLADDTKGD